MKSNKFLLAATALLLSFGAFSQQSDTTKKDTAARRTDSTKMDTTKKSSPDLQSTTTGSQGQQQGTNQPSTTVTGTGSTNATGAASSTTTTGTGSSTTGATTATGSTTTTGTDNNTSTTGTSGTTNGGTSAASSVPKPNFGRYYIPVLGTYNATAAASGTTTTNTSDAATSVKVTPDESNPGKVWVEGLSASRFYALLKTAPGTYKIPAQKAENISVAEGTLIYDDNSKQITVCTGCGYNEQAPAVADDVATSTSTESSSKTSKKGQQNMKSKKVPVVTFTGTKADQGTVSLLQ